MGQVRVVSWNMLGRAPGRVGLHRLVDAFQPDILLLQEADADAIDHDPQLTDAYPHRHYGVPPAHRRDLAILSRFPMADAGELATPRRVFDRARLVWADADLPDGRRLRVASVHATAPDSLLPPPYNPIRRNRQLRAIRRFAHDLVRSDPPLVIGGDFNTIRYEIPGMSDVALSMGRPGATWRGLPVGWIPPLLRLDRIFVGPGIDVDGLHVGCEFAGSDHCPLIATLSLGSGEPNAT
jgi:endonuclease/exonuclease/phosphatase family metal-dependent hydrolase